MKEQMDALFYKQNEVDEALKCPVCQTTFQDPRILPCGDCMCKSCIQVKTELNNNQIIDCAVCQEQHTNLDVNSLMKNHILNRLLSIKPIEVYRSKLVEKLKSNLIEIKSMIDVEMENLIQARQSIKDYCSLLYNQVNEATENEMQNVKKCHDVLIEQIKDYEAKQLNELQNNKRKSDGQEEIENEKKRCKTETPRENVDQDEFASNSKLIRNSAIEFVEKQVSYLKQADIKDEDIEQSIEESIQIRENIKQHIRESAENRSATSDIKLEFIVSKHEKLVGQVKIHVPKPRFSVKSLDIDKKLSNQEICSIEYIDHKIPYLLVMSTSANNFYVNLVNEKGKLIKQYEILKSKSTICNYKFETAVNKNQALICFSYSEVNMPKCSIPCLFYKNNLIKLIKSDNLLSDSILCSTISETACYFILERRNTYRIYLEIYDILLDKYRTCGLDSLFFLPTNITSFRVFNHKLYLYSKNEIYVMNDADSICKKSFQFSSDQFYVTNEFYLIKFDQNSNKIAFYDFVGNWLDEYVLPIETDLFEIKHFSNQRVLCYYKSKSHKITIIELN